MKTVAELEIQFSEDTNTTFIFEPPLQVSDNANSLGQFVAGVTLTGCSQSSCNAFGQVLNQSYQDAYEDFRSAGRDHAQAITYVAQLVKDHLTDSINGQEVIVIE